MLSRALAMSFELSILPARQLLFTLTGCVQEADEKAKLIQAEKQLKYASEYVKKHKLANKEEEGILASQMHELIVQKLQQLTGARLVL